MITKPGSYSITVFCGNSDNECVVVATFLSGAQYNMLEFSLEAMIKFIEDFFDDSFKIQNEDRVKLLFEDMLKIHETYKNREKTPITKTITEVRTINYLGFLQFDIVFKDDDRQTMWILTND